MKAAGFIRTAMKAINWRKFRVWPFYCPVCSHGSVIVRLDASPIGIRCLRCLATGIHMSIVEVITEVVPDLESKHVYELSSRGALFEYLQKNAGALTYSEYFDDVVCGEYRNGIQCQNVEKLTYEDCLFDVCTSTEVFEHVSNDIGGFSEVLRVLKPGGIFLFTVPLNSGCTVERVRKHPIQNGELEYLLPPNYHDDIIRGSSNVLVFRDYGIDIVNRLEMSGFTKAEILIPNGHLPWGYKASVIVGYK